MYDLDGRHPELPTCFSVTSSNEVDELGTFNARIATNGSIAGSYTDDMFSNVTSSTGSATNFLRYTAREFDTETEL